MATNPVGYFAEFNPDIDDWVVYCERLQEYFTANSLEEEKKVATLLSLIGTKTYILLRDLCNPIAPNKKTFKQLDEVMKSHFTKQPVIWRERKKFHEATQGTHETVAEWHARICKMAVECKFGANLELFLREKFVTGLKAESTFDRICEEDENVTLSKVLELAKKKENLATRGEDVNFARKAMMQRHFKPMGFGQAKAGNCAGADGGRRKPNQHDQRHRYQGQGRNRFSNLGDGGGFEQNGGRGNKIIGQLCRVCGNKHTGQCIYSNYVCSKCKKRDI